MKNCRWSFIVGAVVGAVVACAMDAQLHRRDLQETRLPLRVTHCISANYGPRAADAVLTVTFDTAGASAYFTRIGR
jgi:hypothetical protein